MSRNAKESAKPSTAAQAGDDAANTQPVPAAPPAPAAPRAQLRAPRMGEQVSVIAEAGRVLPNLEFGGYYSETTAGPATVNARILRLLRDGDLLRVPL